MNKFHIKITDNETGETLHDRDACAIIGSFATDPDDVYLMVYTHCGIKGLVSASCSALLAAHLGSEDLPRKLRRKIRRFNHAKFIKNQNKKQKGE